MHSILAAISVACSAYMVGQQNPAGALAFSLLAVVNLSLAYLDQKKAGQNQT